MIKYSDAIEVGRTLLGTPYTTYDCINLQKKIIRTAPGGDSKYQIAGTNSLWRSRDLSNKRKGIADAKPGEFVFKWKSQDTDKYPDGLGDFHHIGLVTENKTVIHSSSVENYKGGYYPGGVGVIETVLDSKWMWTATHRLIIPKDGEEPMIIEKMKVITEKDPLNVRDEPSKSGRVIGKVPKGSIVDSVSRSGSWDFIRYENIQGYAANQFLMEWYEPDPEPEPEPVPESGYAVIIDSNGDKFCVKFPFQIYGSNQVNLND